VRQLLALRHRHIAPYLRTLRRGGTFDILGDLLRLHWALDADIQLRTLANFSERSLTIPITPSGTVIFAEGVHSSGDAGNHFESGAIHVSFGPVDV